MAEPKDAHRLEHLIGEDDGDDDGHVGHDECIVMVGVMACATIRATVVLPVPGLPSKIRWSDDSDVTGRPASRRSTCHVAPFLSVWR